MDAQFKILPKNEDGWIDLARFIHENRALVRVGEKLKKYHIDVPRVFIDRYENEIERINSHMHR